MFSENNRISGRQMYRLMTYDLLGIGTLLVPQMLAKAAARDGILSIGIGMAAALMYLWILRRIAPPAQESYPEYMKRQLGRIGGGIVQAGYLIYLVLLAGYVAYLFADVILRDLLRGESFYLILSVIMLLVLYGLAGGIEGRARAYEMLFWFLLIPLFLMLFAAADEVCTDYWAPLGMSSLKGVAGGAYGVFLNLSFAFLLLFSGTYVRRQETLFAAGKRAILFVGCLHAVLYLVLEGIFGVPALAGMDYPAVTLMSTVKISGGFLKRTDAFMFGVWFFTLYALLNSCVFYGSSIAEKLWKPILKMPKGKKYMWIFYGSVAVAASAAAICFYRSRAVFDWYERFLWYVGTPFLVLAPVFTAQKKWGRRMLALAVICAAALLVMTGCAPAELEDRDFPIDIAVRDMKDAGLTWYEAEQEGNRMVDYSHLKVLILEQEFVEDEAAVQEWLTFLKEKSEVPRNAYVVVTEDAEALLAQSETLGEAVGDYLEEQFENVSQIKKQAYPTIGSLYQEMDNRQETLFLPYVTVEEEKPAVEQYYVWKRGTPAGMVAGEAARLAFFTQNRMMEYVLPLEEGMLLLSDASNEIAFTKKDGVRKVVVTIHCSGSVQGTGGKENEGKLALSAEDYMNRMAANVRQEKQVDLTGSYRKLGGAARGWYEEYQERGENYEEEVEVVYRVKINWIHLS